MNDKAMKLTNSLHELGYTIEFIEDNHPPIDDLLLAQTIRTLRLCASFPAWRDELVKRLPTPARV